MAGGVRREESFESRWIALTKEREKFLKLPMAGLIVVILELPGKSTHRQNSSHGSQVDTTDIGIGIPGFQSIGSGTNHCRVNHVVPEVEKVWVFKVRMGPWFESLFTQANCAAIREKNRILVLVIDGCSDNDAWTATFRNIGRRSRAQCSRWQGNKVTCIIFLKFCAQ